MAHSATVGAGFHPRPADLAGWLYGRMAIRPWFAGRLPSSPTRQPIGATVFVGATALDRPALDLRNTVLPCTTRVGAAIGRLRARNARPYNGPQRNRRGGVPSPPDRPRGMVVGADGNPPVVCGTIAIVPYDATCRRNSFCRGDRPDRPALDPQNTVLTCQGDQWLHTPNTPRR